MMTVMVIRGVTLDGASQGIEYYLNPDFDRLSDSVVSVEHQALEAPVSITGLWLLRILRSGKFSAVLVAQRKAYSVYQ